MRACSEASRGGVVALAARHARVFVEWLGRRCQPVAVIAPVGAGRSVYGELVLPDPRTTFATLGSCCNRAEPGRELWTTARRALTGLLLAVTVGSGFGDAGRPVNDGGHDGPPLGHLAAGHAARSPGWCWPCCGFGAGDGTPVFTVFCRLPAGGLYWCLARHPHAGFAFEGYGPRLPAALAHAPAGCVPAHVAAYLFPAWITALGSSWKVAVMAELLATSDGVGAALAVSRSHLDMGASLAWICAVVGILLLLEYGGARTHQARTGALARGRSMTAANTHQLRRARPAPCLTARR